MPHRDRPEISPDNVPAPLPDHDAFAADPTLQAGVTRHGGKWADELLHEIGAAAGSAEAHDLGDLANRYPPALRTHDRAGQRVDEVDFHPAWHELLGRAVGWGLTGSPWSAPGPGAHVARTAGFYLWSQVEQGHLCPVSMTHAAVPALRTDKELAAAWEPLLTSRRYEPGLVPAAGKAGALAGMGMTETHGGSDVRSNSTAATATDTAGVYTLTGHKWFCSAPMSDVFLVLAQAAGGLTCFVLPRVLDDGSRNAFHIRRLKDKLGNRSNASSEVEFDAAVAYRLGEEGRGLRTIMAMVAATRLDCVAGSAAIVRQAAVRATHYAHGRTAFGSTLIDKPLMRNVLTDLAVESEAATALLMRLAAAADADEQALLRIALPVAKFWVCKRAPGMIAEALECFGGNGYVEDWGMARLYREAPLNSIWEGSGSVNALDLLRALREPQNVDAVLAELAESRGADQHLDRAVTDLLTELADLTDLERRARRLGERTALVLTGALLVRHGAPAVADVFCATRLGGTGGHTFGTVPGTPDDERILSRVWAD
ncbi:MAG: DNA alkylation response protein [Streptosporangiales bacterium]|nr:DNA alkylation response protein [Streptosporangiales bacterium]